MVSSTRVQVLANFIDMIVTSSTWLKACCLSVDKAKNSYQTLMENTFGHMMGTSEVKDGP